MGAGKSTIGKEVAALSGRPFVDVDRVIESRHGPVAELFELGEPEFRRIEEEVAAEALASPVPAVIALGGGAVTSQRTRELLLKAFTLWVEVDVRDAWHRAGGSGRPLARDEAQFRRLFEERQPLYDEVSAGLVESTEDVLLEALRISVGRGLLADLENMLGESPDALAVIGDEHVLELHPLGFAPLNVHPVPRGEAAKTPAILEQLWTELGVKRGGTIDDRRRRVRGGDVPARRSLDCRPDDAARSGRRGDRRQNGDRPPCRQEPRRRIPLPGRSHRRPGRAHDAERRAAP